MPNWCENRVTIIGAPAQIERLLEEAKGSKSRFSLQSLVPCPKLLLEATSGSYEMGYEVKYGHWGDVASYPWMVEANGGEPILTREVALRVLEEIRPEFLEHADAYKANVDQHGYTSWYEWCCDNWGTKWDIRVEGIEEAETNAPNEAIQFCFDSAWAPPLAAFRSISEKYPELIFQVEFYEEGMDFLGVHEYVAGELTEQDEGTCSSDAERFEFAPEPEEDWEDEEE